MSNRLEQLNVAYKKALGAVFLKDFPHFTNLTVADFLLDPSTQTGRVFLKTDQKTIDALVGERGKIQDALKKYVKTRYTPRLTFVIDDEYLDKMDELFETIETP